MSNEVEELEARFRHRGVISGRTTLLPVGAAMEFIEALRGIGAPIFGVESFRLQDGGVYPLMDHILDLSSGCRDPWTEGAEFIRQRYNAGFHFDVVL